MERVPVTPGVLDLSFYREKVATGGKTEVRKQLESIFARHRQIRTKGRSWGQSSSFLCSRANKKKK
jgi:hypothetical protein